MCFICKSVSASVIDEIGRLSVHVDVVGKINEADEIFNYCHIEYKVYSKCKKIE